MVTKIELSATTIIIEPGRDFIEVAIYEDDILMNNIVLDRTETRQLASLLIKAADESEGES